MGLTDDSNESRFLKRGEKKKQIKAGLPGPDEDQLPPPVKTIHAEKESTVGRNDPCPCGSGKKHKKCCGK